MGVSGLWELIRPAASRTSLAALGRDAFLANRNGLRAFVIGIDASIWIFHAQATQAGANPFLRTLFYKIANLMQHPVLPVFVFDGPNKPVVKRNQRVQGRFGTNDLHSIRFKQLLDVCGLEWWNAPGEAEAELALMNRQGKIDAVLSDDVDSLLFGATCILRNNSPTLSGATGGNNGPTELRQYDMFRACDIREAWAREGSSLKTEEDCRHAMVLIALLSGGDYITEGIAGLGPTISMGLAHAGASNFLKLYNKDKTAFESKIGNIQRFMVNELRTNDSGFIGRKNPTKAAKLEALSPSEVFNDLPLEAYLRPSRSPDDPALGWPGFGKGEASSTRGMGRYGGRWDLESCARACEQFFEWGTVDAVCKKFASENGLFCSEVMNEARQKVLAADRRKGRRKSSLSRLSLGGASPARITSFFSNQEFRRASLPAVDTGAPDHLVKVTSTRPSPTCEGMTELRLSFKVDKYVERCKSVMKGSRVDPADLPPEERAALGLVDVAQPAADTTIKDEVRTWIPDYLIRAAWPSLAEEYDASVASKAAAAEAKAAAKTARATAKAARATQTTPKKRTKKKGVTTENTEAFVGYFTQAPQTSSSPRTESVSSLSDMIESLSLPDPPSPTPVRRRKDTVPLFDPAPDSPISPLPASPTLASRRSRTGTAAAPTPKTKPARSRKATSVTPSEAPATPTPRRRRSPSKAKSLTVEADEKPRTIAPLPTSSPPSSPDVVAISPVPLPKPKRASRKKAATPTPLVDHDKRSRSDMSSSALDRSTPTRPPASRARIATRRGRGTTITPTRCGGDSADAPIVLGDSDDEPTPPSPPRRGRPRKTTPASPILRTSTSGNVPKPKPPSPRSMTTKTAVSKPTPTRTAPTTTKTTSITTSTGTVTASPSQVDVQSTLDFLVVGRNRRPAAKPIPLPATPLTPSTPPLPKNYTVEVDSDGVEHIYIGGKD